MPNRIVSRSSYFHCVIEAVEPRRLLSATIRGSVVYDDNGNGIVESGETVPVWTSAVYADQNNNGQRDAGEPFAQQAPYSTDYALVVPGTGTYTVRVDSTNGAIVSTPALTVNATNGFVTFGNNFGVIRNGSVSFSVFVDTNGNGTQDSGESTNYRAAVFVDLDEDGVVDANEPSNVSDGSNALTFSLRPGAYRFAVVPMPGMVGTTGSVAKTITGGIGYFPTPIGVQQTPTLVGTAYADSNGNEKLDSTDARFVGYTVWADLNANSSVDAGEPTAVTDASGVYTLTSPLLGTLRTIRLRDNTGALTSLSTSAVGSTTGPATQVDLRQRVTNVATGRVYADLNANGVYEATANYIEPYAIGVTMFADVNNNGVFDSSEPSDVTDTGGFYTMAVLNGTFPIRALPANDYTPENAPTPVNFSGNTRVNLSVTPLIDSRQTRNRAALSGQVFLDPNRNDRMDPGETPVANQVVYIDTNGNGVRDAGEGSGTTDASGRYLLIEQPPTVNNPPTLARVDTTAGCRNVTTSSGVGTGVQIYATQSANAPLGLTAVPNVGVSSSSLDVDNNQTFNVLFTNAVGPTAQQDDFTLEWYFNNQWALIPKPFGTFTRGSIDGRTIVTLTPAQLLPDGSYRLTLLPNAVNDPTGRSSGAATSFTFRILAGDADGNGVVNFTDLLVLARNYGAAGSTFTQGDFNRDGNVNFSDLLILASRYGKTVTPPAGVAGASADHSDSVTIADDVLA
ncbi:MAG: dockerin type I domain-containing protein [Tepidisphaeraceae bacterium]